MEGSFFYQAGRYHRRKSQNRYLQNQKSAGAQGGDRGSPPFPDLYVFLSHFLIQSSLVVETEPRPSNGLLPIT